MADTKPTETTGPSNLSLPFARGYRRFGTGCGGGKTGHPRRVASHIPRLYLRAMTYIIADPCIGTKDASCVDVCPVDCIYEADDQYYIHPEECIDCGACVPECPVEAIFPDDEVPEEWQGYIAKNYEHFQVPPP